jgi:hypothetical protein
VFGRIHIALQLFISDVRLHAHEVTEHPSHDVFSDDDNLLSKVLDPARVRGKVDLGDSSSQTTCDRRQERTFREGGVARNVEWSRHQHEVCVSGDLRV